jgi:hypothetical protein
MVINIQRGVFLISLFLLVQNLSAQQGLIQKIQLDDYYRQQQLIGNSTDSIANSFCLIPYQYRFKNSQNFGKKDSILLTSNFGYTMQNNSALPYSYNAETFLPVAGFQQRFTAGIQMESKHFSFIFQPEFVTAANPPLDNLLPPESNSLNNYWGKFFAMIGNKIDMPSWFGNEPISKAYPGQSAIRYKTPQFAIGISTENLWWGPARFNSLVMSNNAPGFLHASINTVAPIKTPVGKFEAQLIFGGLKNSGITPPEFKRIEQLGCPQCYEAPPENNSRTIAGLVISFSPKGMENLHIGITSVSYKYADTNLSAAKLGSLFFRYAMPKEHAEIYAEYGRSDKGIGPFDIFKDSVPYGFTIGFRKMIPLNNQKAHISISTEITHLGLSKAALIFDRNSVFGGPNPNSNSWYTNANIRHGYTNYGRVMGASIGPGSNSQTINIAWVKNQHQLGIQVQRVMRNTDFYYYNYFNGYIGAGNTSAFWVDISTSLFAQWAFKNFLLAGSIDNLSSINYKWLKLDGGFADPSSLSDKRNIQLRLSLLYSVKWF